NPAMAAEAFTLLRALGYRGLGSLEFKHRQRDGGYYFIEMNTRLPWYNGLFADAGVNLPYLAYLDLIGEEGAASTQRDGTTWVSFHNYSGCRREMKGENRIGRLRFAAHILKARSYAWWNWGDPAPFLASLLLAARRAVGSLLRRLGLR